MLASLDYSSAGIKLWDVSTGTNMAILRGHTSAIHSVAFSPDGSTLVSGAQDNTVKMWDVETERNIATLEGHISFVWSVAFSPDGGNPRFRVMGWHGPTVGRCDETNYRHPWS